MTHSELHDSTLEHGRTDAPSQAHLRAARLPSFRTCLERSAMSEEGFVGALLQTSLSSRRVDTARPRAPTGCIPALQTQPHRT